MNSRKVNLVYFSATETTKKVVEFIAQGTGIKNIKSYDITKEQSNSVVFDNDELVIFGFPVYSGRIPQISVPNIQKFKGKNTPAIIVCVYGNRDYDDALLELKNMVTAQGFKIISAGAFIGQHSIFPKTAISRPDNQDKIIAIHFGQESLRKLFDISDIAKIGTIEVKGNYPYKTIKSIPLTPKCNNSCNKCGKCVRRCPTGAIPISNPRKTDKSKCIACARCIHVCSTHSRSFGGVLYKLVSLKFNKTNAKRIEPETIFV